VRIGCHRNAWGCLNVAFHPKSNEQISALPRLSQKPFEITLHYALPKLPLQPLTPLEP